MALEPRPNPAPQPRPHPAERKSFGSSIHDRVHKETGKEPVDPSKFNVGKTAERDMASQQPVGQARDTHEKKA